MTQVPFSLRQRIFPRTTRQAMKKSDSAPMRFILSVTASQAMSLMIGSGPSVNFKRSLSSNKAGIVFSDGIAMTPKTEIEIRRMEKDGKGKSMTMLVNHAVRSLVGDVPRLRTGAVFLAVAGLGIFVSACNKSQAAKAAPVPEVEVATVETRDVPVYSEWVATLDGYVNAEIRPQVSGYIIRQNYTEGSLVRKGEVLFEIDPRPFTAALDRAKGDLAQAQAQLGKSTLDVERHTPRAEARAIAKSQLDNEVQAKLGAQAAVESAKAAVEQAELNLEWTKVTSLIDGIAGIAQVQIGNLVGPNSVLTSVSQVEPIKVFFPITEQE